MSDQETEFEYVAFDHERDVLRLRLPPDQELVEEFAFEPRTSAVEKRMNEFVRTWMARRPGDRPGTGSA
jgi:hypothetical protein